MEAGLVEGRAARLGCDLDRPHIVLAAEPADEALERSLAARSRARSSTDARTRCARCCACRPAGSGRPGAVRRRTPTAPFPSPSGFRASAPGSRASAEGFEEARQALFGTVVLDRETSVVAFEELGAYKYLLRIAAEGGVRDATIDAVTRIADYDRERGASLLPTLEEFLERRGSISATSDALHIHSNTLRQRLRRIGDLSGVDLRRDDWLMIEIAVKLVQLRLVLAAR